MTHRTLAELEAGLPHVGAAPRGEGRVELIVRRPAQEEREVLSEAMLDTARGLVGDNWMARGSKATADGSAHPDMQLTLMGARAAALIAGSAERWPLAGDQLFVELDLSVEGLPPGSRLAVGSAVIEITAQPHTGCGKFARRFGVDALRFVNSEAGRALRLRGVNAKVICAGTVRAGEKIATIDAANVASQPAG